MAPEAPCFVTGGAGFAGRHLVDRLHTAGHDVLAPSHAELDLLDGAAVARFVGRTQPARVFHLAALASVASSWASPAETICANQAMTVNLLEAVRTEAPGAAVLVASSGEVYGEPDALPVTEETALRPVSPYAVSKAGCELAAELYERVHGMTVVRTRAFNHAGPGQSADYVVGSLTRQLAEAEIGGRRSVTVRTGEPSVARDFCDVRDVVRAYELAIEAPSRAYNVSSGRAVSIDRLVALLAEVTELEITHEVDPARARPVDIARIEGSSARLEEAIGWRPDIPLPKTLADAVAAWRDLLG